MIFTPGQKLFGDRYQIIREFGRGGFGITYLAEDNKGKQFVIKTLNENSQQSSDAEKLKADFKDEALKLATCTHPHIAKYENFFNERDIPCLVMEYISGANLWDNIKKQGILEELTALLYISQIGSALTEIHSKGLLHRDVKPKNMMLRNNFEVVLIDFGLARDFIPDQTLSKIEPLTHGFAAIEQYIHDSQQGEFTDVYGLAATLYHLLTGKVPTPSFSRSTGIPLEKPIDINPKINPVINQSILMGMTLYPNDDNRPKSIQDWLDSFGTLIPSINSNAPTLRIPGIRRISEIEAEMEENNFDDEINLIEFPNFNKIKGFINVIKDIFASISSPNSTNHQINNVVNNEINNTNSLKNQSNQITQPQQNYELRERNIADLLIARNLPGLFDKLLDLKGFRINQNYTLRWLYAVGGQSIVYLAEKLYGGLVIVKIPYLDYHRPAYISQEQINNSRHHLSKEAELLKKFNYNNLPFLYDFIYGENPLNADYRSNETANQEPYLVMEFIEGMDLLEVTRYLHNQSIIKYEQIELLAWETASKMTDLCITLFKEGYLYSDINPLNFIFTANNSQIRILDAGSLIPLRPDENISPPFTESYIPVEYLESYEQGNIIYPNPNYVMYTLGKMLWEVLTNKQPYPGENPNLSETILKNYSPELQKLISNLIQYKYSSFKNLQQTINQQML
ncbi:protein kinase [Anabaena sp. AL93]|jgi:serine/threonine protein kinase|uniref:protein kinase domain-containing protein n=1 Tax=Anabaena sp. AL93 TaxID=1678133 RepID=UPI0025C42567|nr:protein kinase [Anabaena sp. AL93]